MSHPPPSSPPGSPPRKHRPSAQPVREDVEFEGDPTAINNQIPHTQGASLRPLATGVPQSPAPRQFASASPSLSHIGAAPVAPAAHGPAAPGPAPSYAPNPGLAPPAMSPPAHQPPHQPPPPGAHHGGLALQTMPPAQLAVTSGAIAPSTPYVARSRI